MNRTPLVPLALAALLGACATASAPQTDSTATPRSVERPISRDLALATFDSAWSRINSSYYDPDFRGLDWTAVRDELRPEAAAAGTNEELRAVLRRMLGRLGESHFAVFPAEQVDAIRGDAPPDSDESAEDPGTSADPEVSSTPADDEPEIVPDADLGIELRWVEGELTVFRVAEGGAARTGIRPGFVVDSIAGRDVKVWREAIASAETETGRTGLRTRTLTAAMDLMQGQAGSRVELVLRDGSGTVERFNVERTPTPGQLIEFGNLPPMFAELEYERREIGAGDCVGVVRFNIWMVPLIAEFNQAVDALSDCRGIVIDLRGNPGGVGGMVMATAGSFFEERADLGVVTSRSGEMRFVAMPRSLDTRGELREPFDGRLAVLIDELSMSTSEIFAAGIASTGRGRIFGSPTPGYALPALMLRLPNDDVLYHVVANLTDPDGTRIEGAGVVPDELVSPTRDALLAGRDPALERALEWAARPHGNETPR